MLALYRRHPWLTAAFLVAAVASLALSWQFLQLMAARWTPEAHVAVEGWMTPRYVVHAFGLPRDDLAPILGLADDDTPFRSLNDLAAESGKDPEALIAEVEAAVAAAIAAHGETP